MMSHTTTLKNAKYKNWVKGGLALKYLKNGSSGFAQYVAETEHNNMLRDCGIISGTLCNDCDLKSLKPLHQASNCPYSKRGCNCARKSTKPCKSKICDALFEEILKHHGSGEPNWKNTDMSKWTTTAWEVAKCFINAPGYDKTQSAADTDIGGLLHMFINNQLFHNHFSCPILLVDKVREWRNRIFHSAAMELEDLELAHAVKDIITLLEDKQEMKYLECCKQAIHNLVQLQSEKFIITMEDEADVCKAAITSINLKTDELSLSQEEIKHNLKDSVDQLNANYEQTQSHVAKVEQKLQGEIDSLRERVNRHDFQIEDLHQRVSTLQKDAEELKKKEGQYRSHLEQTEERIQIQRDLKDLYMKSYVTTSMSPLLKTQNNVDIREVYVKPEILRNQEGKHTRGEKMQQQMSIHSYRDIFEADGKSPRRIYVLGDVGSGKSAFCKMMIKNWCMSRDSAQTEDEELMKRFEFLFYVPLRTVPQINNVEEMIRIYYKLFEETLKSIFQTMPERCCILMDGLDEWKHRETELHREHETVGLPWVCGMSDVTIVTTSRPSAPGIINMKHSDYDLKLTLCGVENIETLVERYMSGQSSKTDILFRLIQNQILNLKKTPLLLQHVVWLISKGETVGNCLTELYSSVVNITLRWNKQNRTEKTFEDRARSNLSLPKQLIGKYPAFDEYGPVILMLGRLAFDILTKGCQLSFGLRKLTEVGVDESLHSRLLGTGLLTEEVRPDPTSEDTQFTFTHISFLEYFAALYVASHQNTEASRSTDILSLLQARCRSVKEVLQLENMLIMLCGLSPDLTSDLCRLLYNTAQEDQTFLAQRQQYCELDSWPRMHNEYIHEAKQYQQLAVRCVHECKLSTNSCNTRIPLLDVVISDQDIETEINKLVDHSGVRSLCLHWMQSIFLSEFKNLETLVIEDSNFPHDNLGALTTYITQTVTLRNISLFNIKCIENWSSDTCCQHEIDLSHHDQLETVYVRAIGKICIHSINTVNLRTIRFPFGGEFLKPWTSRVNNCSRLSVITLRIISCSSSVLSSIVEYINQSVLLRDIKLVSIWCTDNKSTRYQLDLSRCDQLQKYAVYLNDNLTINNVVASKLTYFHTDSVNVVRCLRCSATLTDLGLYRIKYNTEIHEIVLTIPHIWRLKLSMLEVEEDVFKVVHNMKHLNYIELDDVKMSLSSWCSFVDSLLNLDQSVTVETNSSSAFGTPKSEEYVMGRPEKYRILDKGLFGFHFFTLK